MTAYETVYSAFRDKVTDYDLAGITDTDEASILFGYMKSAIGKFGRICNKLNDRDDLLNQFNGDLTDTEIDIISELMVESWTKPKLYDSEKLRNSLSTKDYSFFSPANLLNQLRELNQQAKKNARAMMNEYSILHSEFANKNPRASL